MVDFEKALINATKVYEGANGIVGCLFHFTKNIRKKANQSIERIKRHCGKASKEV